MQGESALKKRFDLWQVRRSDGRERPGRPDENQRKIVPIINTSAGSVSPYAGHARQGATIVPRCLFFVEETESTAIIKAGQTVTVNPRRGPYDKAPWKNLDLTAITGQTIESRHVFDVHLGETVVPYATLAPLKAVLPLKRGAPELPTHEGGPGGVRLEALEWRMRERWQTVSGLWEGNKATATTLSLLGQINYMRKLSAQLDWQLARDARPVRLIYTDGGAPTAALLSDNWQHR